MSSRNLRYIFIDKDTGETFAPSLSVTAWVYPQNIDGSARTIVADRTHQFDGARPSMWVDIHDEQTGRLVLRHQWSWSGPSDISSIYIPSLDMYIDWSQYA